MDWKDKHRERIKEYRRAQQAEYYERNKEKLKAQQAEYRKNNKEKIAEYRERNKEKIKVKNAKYRERNKEKIKGLNTEYHERNKETLRERDARRQSAKQARKFSLIQQLGGKCVRCGEDHLLVLDFHHQDPLTKENEVPKLLNAASKYKEAQEEAQKCIVLCSNCHRKEHHELSWLANFPGSDLYICPWEHSAFTKKKTKEKQEQEMEVFIDTQLNYSAPYLT